MSSRRMVGTPPSAFAPGRFAHPTHRPSRPHFQLCSSKHCSENTIPKTARDTVVSVRKLVMVEVMLQHGGRQNCGIVMGAIMDQQIPGIGNENAGHHSASHDRVERGEGQPDLPEDLVDSISRPCVMNSVLYRGDGMQHTTMGDVFSQCPYHETATEQN